MDFSLQATLFAFVGGLGLFLFGLKFMSEALQLVAGDKMRTILEEGTKNPVRGVITGAIVTSLIQSSSATTVLTVGLVNARLLTLRQAIGVIMGANIGTTITAYLIGFNLKEYALPILGIGALIFIFAKKKKPQMIGQAILGFGVLFFGLTVMGDGMKPLKDLPYFLQLMSSVENNAAIGVFVGMLFTFIVQSSSATIGVLQELANQGAVTYTQAVPILFGDNIGTTVTALLAAIGAGVAARRTALTHFLFNAVGTLIFLPLFLMGIFDHIIVFFTNSIFSLLPGFAGSWDTLNIKLQIAQTHAVFNLSNTLIQLPMVAVLAFIVTKLIPDQPGELLEAELATRFIDERFLANPPMALAQATRETLHMGDLAKQAFANAIAYFNTRDEHLYNKAMALEDTLDKLETKITDYIVLIFQKNLSSADSNRAHTVLESLNDIERIGDHCENIVEQGIYATRNDVSFSDEAKKELDNIIGVTAETLEFSFEALEKDDARIARRVLENQRIIDSLQLEYRKNHIKRLNDRVCNGSNGAVFLDVLANLERIGAHCRNIAGYVLGGI